MTSIVSGKTGVWRGFWEFHDPEKIEQAQRELPGGEVSNVPEGGQSHPRRR